MIAVDTSALMAILLEEPQAEAILFAISTAGKVLIGQPTLVELHLVASGRSRPSMAEDAAGLMVGGPFVPVDFTATHLAAATDAFDRYGKGRHPASLNYGDCMAYAVAKVAGCPLLYKGEDFARTDIRSAL
ncbi:type II toxin-antitoxin system VapC family toxin [Sphingomonas sp. KR1UV-12]|uniref:Ribonuclease VapC n=1 Tax=Sphingomonas aurea TaxID=3063994 RepID=A0ABT9ELV3_9SPHN|nr:type II toxin-antitoxin system VapC family toxin [Sphingomonas sp. KR1UV-12]MDP1027919.1 type II toxin-antitoxin system VapC family toxin [Sphingomonas sp. KR1UV-12]